MNIINLNDLKKKSGVYVIRHLDPYTPKDKLYVKIGEGLDLYKRIKDYETYFPFGTEILFVLTTPKEQRKQEEKLIHKEFKKYRIPSTEHFQIGNDIGLIEDYIKEREGLIINQPVERLKKTRAPQGCFNFENGEVKWDITSTKEHLPNCIIDPEEKAGVVDKAGGRVRKVGMEFDNVYGQYPISEKGKKVYEAICRGERHRQKTGTSKR